MFNCSLYLNQELSNLGDLQFLFIDLAIILVIVFTSEYGKTATFIKLHSLLILLIDDIVNDFVRTRWYIHYFMDILLPALFLFSHKACTSISSTGIRGDGEKVGE